MRPNEDVYRAIIGFVTRSTTMSPAAVRAHWRALPAPSSASTASTHSSVPGRSARCIAPQYPPAAHGRDQGPAAASARVYRVSRAVRARSRRSAPIPTFTLHDIGREGDRLSGDGAVRGVSHSVPLGPGQMSNLHRGWPWSRVCGKKRPRIVTWRRDKTNTVSGGRN